MKEIDILDLIPPEGVAEVDRIGYELLGQYGYDVSGVTAEALLQELKANGDELIYKGQTDTENGKIKVRYKLYRKGQLIAKSRAVEFIPVKEETDGENGADKKGSTANP